MADENLTRRVAILAGLPQCKGISADDLASIVSLTTIKFLDYTHREEDLGTRADGMIAELSLIAIAMMGAEGTTSASEGGISRAWEDIPPSLRKRLNAYRRINATFTP